MALAVTVQNPVPGTGAAGPLVKVIVKIVASGSYVTNGDTLNLVGLLPGGSATIPLFVNILSQSGSGFLYQYVRGTKMSDGKMQVLIPTTTGGDIRFSQHSAAAYVAGVTGDTIIAEITMRENPA